MNYSRAAALEYLARIKGIQPHELDIHPETFQRLTAATFGALGVLIVATMVVGVLS